LTQHGKAHPLVVGNGRVLRKIAARDRGQCAGLIAQTAGGGFDVMAPATS